MPGPQTIVTPGGERLVVIPEDEYRRLVEAAEDLADAAAFDRAVARLAGGQDELVPLAVAKRLLDGENPVRVWREHRGLEVAEVAAAAGIAAPYLLQIESGRRKGTVAARAAIARALGVDRDDLVAGRPARAGARQLRRRGDGPRAGGARRRATRRLES